MIKILHTSDIHIGAKLNWLGEKSEIQRQQILNTFEKTINVAIKKRVDVFLIAGDLFDTYSPSNLSVSFVKSQFEKLQTNNIKTVLIPGNHDRLIPGSVLTQPDFLSKEAGFCFNTPGCSSFIIPELELTVFAHAIDKQFSEDRPLQKINKLFETSEKTKHNLALVHGALQINNNKGNYPILKEDISSSKFDYIAVGDWHSMLDVSDGVKAWYSGSPEMISKSQKNSGNILYVEIDEANINVEKIPIGVRKAEDYQVNIGKYGEVSQELIKELSLKSDPNLILSVSLEGRRSAFQSLDLEQLQSLCENRFFHLELNDKTDLEITKEDLSKYPETTLVGRYIKNVKNALENVEDDASEKEILEGALYEGIHRILSNKN